MSTGGGGFSSVPGRGCNEHRRERIQTCRGCIKHRRGRIQKWGGCIEHRRGRIQIGRGCTAHRRGQIQFRRGCIEHQRGRILTVVARVSQAPFESQCVSCSCVSQAPSESQYVGASSTVEGGFRVGGVDFETEGLWEKLSPCVGQYLEAAQTILSSSIYSIAVY
jgi:hypothetical protein